MEGRNVNLAPSGDTKGQLYEDFLSAYDKVKAEGVHVSPGVLSRFKELMVDVSRINPEALLGRDKLAYQGALYVLPQAKRLLASLDKRLEVINENMHVEEFQWNESMIGKKVRRYLPETEAISDQLQGAARRFGKDKARDILRETSVLKGSSCLDFYINGDLLSVEGVGVVGYCAYERMFKRTPRLSEIEDDYNYADELEERVSGFLYWELPEEEQVGCKSGEADIVAWIIIPELDANSVAGEDLGVIKSFVSDRGNGYISNFISSIETDKSIISLQQEGVGYDEEYGDIDFTSITMRIRSRSDIGSV